MAEDDAIKSTNDARPKTVGEIRLLTNNEIGVFGCARCPGTMELFAAWDPEEPSELWLSCARCSGPVLVVRIADGVIV